MKRVVAYCIFLCLFNFDSLFVGWSILLIQESEGLKVALFQNEFFRVNFLNTVIHRRWHAGVEILTVFLPFHSSACSPWIILMHFKLCSGCMCSSIGGKLLVVQVSTSNSHQSEEIRLFLLHS